MLVLHQENLIYKKNEMNELALLNLQRRGHFPPQRLLLIFFNITSNFFDVYIKFFCLIHSIKKGIDCNADA